MAKKNMASAKQTSIKALEPVLTPQQQLDNKVDLLQHVLQYAHSICVSNLEDTIKTLQYYCSEALQVIENNKDSDLDYAVTRVMDMISTANNNANGNLGMAIQYLSKHNVAKAELETIQELKAKPGLKLE
jgi:hypothetical protein